MRTLYSDLGINLQRRDPGGGGQDFSISFSQKFLNVSPISFSKTPQ